ncbi:MAG: PAS domain-containing protein [Calditerrivibrio sp.]|nr:PAS domain-containing protein [Calditerrivibrio sp.]
MNTPNLESIFNALENGNIGLWLWDVKTGEAYWSDYAYIMLGYAPKEFPISYDVWASLVHPDDLKGVEQSLFEQLQEKNSFTVEFRLKGKDNTYRWIRGSGKVFKFDENGQYHLVSGVHIDITEKKLVELELEEKLSLLQEAEKIASIGSWDLDIINNKLTWSDEIFVIFEVDKKHFGASYDAFISFVHPDDREKVNTAYWNSVKNKTDYVVEHRLLMPDGRVKYVIERGKTFYDSDGKPIRSVGTVQDITEKVILEQSVKEQEKIFRSIFDNATVGIVFGDLSGNILLANSYFCDLVGYSLEELKNISVAELTFPPDFEQEKKLMRDLLSGNINSYRIEKKYVKKDGSLVWVDLNVTALKDDYNNIKNLIAVIININDKKLAETELIIAKEMADRANNAKTVFLANMSHEIRTPLNGIIGIAQILMSEKLSPLIKDYVNHLHVASLHLLDLINDILDFSKIEAGELKLNFEEFSLKDLVNEIIKVLYYRAKDKNIDLTVFIDPHVPYNLIGDPFRLKQILTNLLGNAIKFTEKGYVSLEIFCSDVNETQTKIYFKVKDTGIGMSQEQLSKLFTPFYQGDLTISKKYGGTGLGLSIVKKIVDALGGEIYVDSELNRGSVFTVALNFKKVDLEESNLKKQLSNLKIAVLDTKTIFVKNVVDILRSLNMEAEYIDFESIDITFKERFDIIFLEYKPEYIEKIKDILNQFYPQKVLLLSDISSQEIKRILDKNVIVIEKPFLPSDIYNAIVELFYKEDKTVSPSLMANIDTANIKALIVEDNPVNQIVLHKMLSQLNIAADIANDGAEAIEMAKNKDYSIIFMDIQMPNMDGYETTRMIRMLPKYIDVPIVAVSAHAFKTDADKSLEAGMNDHLIKPVSLNDLLNALIKWVPLSCKIKKEEEVSGFKIPFLDVEDLYSRGGRLEDIRPLIKIFVEEVEKSLPTIKACLERDEVDILQKEIHKHKGAAGNLSLIEIHKNLQEIDKRLKEKIPPSLYMELFEKFFNQIDMLKSFNDFTKDTFLEMDHDAINDDELITLIQLLDSNNLKAIDKFTHIKNGIVSNYPELVKEIEKCINNLEFKKASDIIKKMLKV